MSVTGKPQPDNTRNWTAKTPSGKTVTDENGKKQSFNSYKDAQAAARSYTVRTGEYAAAVAE